MRSVHEYAVCNSVTDIYSIYHHVDTALMGFDECGKQQLFEFLEHWWININDLFGNFAYVTGKKWR